jgi:hypothetical protein
MNNIEYIKYEIDSGLTYGKLCRAVCKNPSIFIGSVEHSTKLKYRMHSETIEIMLINNTIINIDDSSINYDHYFKTKFVCAGAELYSRTSDLVRNWRKNKIDNILG